MILLGVGSLAKSIPFYRDVVEFELRHSAGGFAFLGAGAITVALSEELGRQIQPRRGALEIILPVDSVEADYDRLHTRATFVNQPHEVTPGTWAATFSDPDGHLLTLFGPR
jgi:predicted enzyme related to lactoylglutathione lyase